MSHIGARSPAAGCSRRRLFSPPAARLTSPAAAPSCASAGIATDKVMAGDPECAPFIKEYAADQVRREICAGHLRFERRSRSRDRRNSETRAISDHPSWCLCSARRLRSSGTSALRTSRWGGKGCCERRQASQEDRWEQRARRAEGAARRRKQLREVGKRSERCGNSCQWWPPCLQRGLPCPHPVRGWQANPSGGRTGDPRIKPAPKVSKPGPDRLPLFRARQRRSDKIRRCYSNHLCDGFIIKFVRTQFN